MNWKAISNQLLARGALLVVAVACYWLLRGTHFSEITERDAEGLNTLRGLEPRHSPRASRVFKGGSPVRVAGRGKARKRRGSRELFHYAHDGSHPDGSR